MIQYMVATFAITIITSRFIQPMRSKISSQLKADMLNEFVSWGSDMVDFFSITDADSIQNDYVIYIILVLFSLSTTQFSFSLVGHDSKTSEETKSKGYKIDTEILAVIRSFILQDFPFLVTRIFILATYSINDYTFFFLLAKNIILCVLQIYRFVIILNKRRLKRKKIESSKVEKVTNEPISQEFEIARL